MTYHDFQSCLDRYKEALLKLIPVYHNKGFTHINISTYIKNSPERIKSLKSQIKSLKAKLNSCKKKKKSKEKAEYLAGELYYLDEELSTLPLKVEQAKKFEKVSSDILEELKIVVKSIDVAADENNMLRFRHKFNDIQGNTDFKLEGNIGERAGAIIIDFLLYLDRNKGAGQATIRQQITKIMESQKNEYLQKYEKKLKKMKAIKGKLRTGGKKVYIPDKELMPFLNGILKEFKEFSHSLSDLAGIAQKRIKEKYGSHKLKNGKVKEYYSVGRLKVFFSNLKNKGQLR